MSWKKTYAMTRGIEGELKHKGDCEPEFSVKQNYKPKTPDKVGSLRTN